MRIFCSASSGITRPASDRKRRSESQATSCWRALAATRQPELVGHCVGVGPYRELLPAHELVAVFGEVYHAKIRAEGLGIGEPAFICHWNSGRTS